ncbi:YhdP family protein [Ruegeria hyattellae]|uniref:YhdP family protein n=1 Tax=Ruegeria hyattellae TaxID=3233337 RepID=UPI00355BEEF7
MTDKKNTPPGVKRRRSRAAHVSIWSMRGFLLLVLLAGFTAIVTVGRNLDAPDWLRQRVEMRLERALGGAQVEFGQVSFVMDQGWRPRLRLRDVTLTAADGTPIARLADTQASLAMRPLLRGRVQPKRIALDGLFVLLRRDVEGNFALTFGDGAAPLERAPNLSGLIEQFDDIFELPQLSSLVSVDMNGLTLGYEDARHGRAWTLDGGRIQVYRTDDVLRMATSFSLLGGRDYASSIEANYTSSIGSREASFGISISDLASEDIAVQSVALAWLEVLRAPISGSLRGGINAAGVLQPVSATLQIGEGVVQPTNETRPIPFRHARTYFTYDPGAQVLRFDEMAVDSAWGMASGVGTAYLNGADRGELDSIEAQFRLSGLQVNPKDVYVEPLQLDAADLDFRLDLSPFRLRLGQMNIYHEDRNLHLRGDLAAAPEGWDLSVDGTLDRLTPQQLLHYWPEGLAVKPRKWVTENLRAGQVTDAELALRLRPDQLPDIYAGFDFDKAEVKFARHLPPLTQARGRADLFGRRFTVTASAGQVVSDAGAVIDAAGSSFIIPDIGIKKAAPGIARLSARGPVTGALSLLNRPPLTLMDKAKLPVDAVQGDFEMTGTLALPLKDKVKLPDMEFHFAGTVTDGASDVLVPGQPVSAASLVLTGDQTGVSLSGPARFGAVPMQIDWRQPIGKGPETRSRLTGWIELSRALLDELNAGLPDSMVGGKGRADIVFEVGGGTPPELAVTSDLVGVVLAIPELGWRKPAGTAGRLELNTVPKPGADIDRIALQASGLRATGQISFGDDKQFERARFSSFELRNWIAAPVELIGRGRGAPDIRLLGGRVDMRNATFGGADAGGGSSSGSGPRILANLDRLQITDSIALTGFRGEFVTGGGPSGNFTAAINGGTPISGQVLRRGGRSGFFLQSNDAGGVFRSAQLLTQARGGTFRLTLEPVESAGHYDGQLRVRNTRIKDAPAMAALLNAISVVGLIDEMSGQGIQFSSMDGRFRLTPTEVIVLEGSAVGPSMGISVDGRVDTERRWLNLRGVISPVYLLNAVGRVISRSGEGLIGFNYTLTGPLTDPRVGVNPLSALTPGILRDIFRGEPRPTVPGEERTRPKETSRDSLTKRQGEDR